LAESGEYAIDLTLSNNGIDQNVYHGKCLIGPHIQKLLDERTKVVEEMETKFLTVRALTIEKNPGAACASVEEIKEEMVFFSKILHCYDVCFSILRRTRTIFNAEEIATLDGAINKLKLLWPTQMSMGTKRGVSDSEIAQPVVRSRPPNHLPGSFLPFYGRPHRKVTQARPTDRRGLLSYSELRIP